MSSTRYSKDKGRAWENAVAEYFKECGFSMAERRTKSGAKDRGDLAGVPLLCGEDKHERSYKLPEWVREAEVEAKNANAPYGVVFVRQNGKPDPADGFAVMSIRGFVQLYRDYMSSFGGF